MASERCGQLARSLSSMAKRVPYEDVQYAAQQLLQCSSNVFTVRSLRSSWCLTCSLSRRCMDHYKNVPLCSMWTVFERMFSPKITKPIWSYLGRIRVRLIIEGFLAIRCLDLFAEGDDFSWETIEKNRNRFYQQQQANQISRETDETIDLLTNALHIHLNLEQNLTFETPNAFMSLDTVQIESLPNRILSPVANAAIRLPEQFTSSVNNQSTISFRVCLLSSVDFK